MGCKRVISLLLGMLGLLAGCQQSDGFYCGDPMPANAQIVQSCTGPNEKCDCSTRSCVVSVDPKECRSGYKYLAVPFARQLVAERCMEEALNDEGNLLDQHEDDQKCPGSGSPGTGGTSSTTTGPQGTTTGQGGMAGAGGGTGGNGGAAGMMSPGGGGGNP